MNRLTQANWSAPKMGGGIILCVCGKIRIFIWKLMDFPIFKYKCQPFETWAFKSILMNNPDKMKRSFAVIILTKAAHNFKLKFLFD